MITADSRCHACGLPMIRVDHHDTHPTCDPHDPDAATIRAQHAAAQLVARQRGQGDAIATAPSDHAAAVEIIRLAATRMPVLSANDLRSIDGWEHLHGPVRGAAMTTAIRRGWLEPVGLDPSSSSTTHGHRIGRYRSLLHHTNGRLL